MNCIAYERPKFAALIFDRVLPVPSLGRSDSIDADFGDFVDKFHDEFYDGASVSDLTKILPEGVTEGYLTGSLVFCLVSHLGQLGDAELRKYAGQFRETTPNNPFAELFQAVAKRYLEAPDKLELWSTWLNASALSKVNQFEILGRNELVELNENDPRPFFQLSGVPVVDDTNLTWEQVLELRRDETAIRRLRRLRVFVASNYQGKTKQEIEDDLQTRIRDFEEASKELGVETTKAVFSVGGSEKIASAVTTGLLATLAGAPTTVAAAVGASAALAGVLIQVVTHRKLFELKQEKDPIRYLVDIKRHSEE